MPKLGEIKKGYEIGRNNYATYQWQACPGCGFQRYVTVYNKIPKQLMCLKCANKTPERRAKVSAMQRKHWASPQVTQRAPGEPPQIGDLQRGKALGYRNNQLYIYRACVDCSKLRWTAYCIKTQTPKGIRCNGCSKAGALNTRWKGGKRIDDAGYVVVTIPKNHPYRAMADKHGRLREHRLIMAEHLGRCLQPNEEPHHKGNGRADNRIEKLELRKRHHGSGKTEFSDADKLEADNYGLKQEIKWLKTRLQEVTKQLDNYCHQTTFNLLTTPSQ